MSVGGNKRLTGEFCMITSCCRIEYSQLVYYEFGVQSVTVLCEWLALIYSTVCGVQSVTVLCEWCTVSYSTVWVVYSQSQYCMCVVCSKLQYCVCGVQSVTVLHEGCTVNNGKVKKWVKPLRCQSAFNQIRQRLSLWLLGDLSILFPFTIM